MVRKDPVLIAALGMFFLSVLLAAAQAQTVPERLRVATREVPPFAMRTAGGKWEGISIELLESARIAFQESAGREVTFEFEEVDLTEMVEAVAEGRADVAAAALTINEQREHDIDFTHPFHTSGLGIAVTARAADGWGPTLRAFVSPVLLKVVLALAAVILLSGVAMYFFERKHNAEHFGGGILSGVASGLWWAAVTVTTVGYGDKTPRTLAGRTLGLLWMFSGLFIVASFTAAVTSALTVTQLQSHLEGPHDLPRYRVATVGGSTSDMYLARRSITARRHADVLEALRSLEAAEVDAVVYDAPILRHLVHQDFAGTLHVLPSRFEKQDYALALPNGSPLRESFNLALLRTIAAPDWQVVLKKYLGEEG